MPFDGVAGPSVGMQRLLRLADKLDTVPDGGYYQNHWHEQTECGTRACALGWAQVEMGEEIGLSFTSSRWSMRPVIDGKVLFTDEQDRKMIRSWQAIGGLFDITGEEALSLFGNSSDTYSRYGGSRDPQVVANAIRAFVSEKLVVAS